MIKIFSQSKLIGFAMTEVRSIGLSQTGIFVIGGPMILERPKEVIALFETAVIELVKKQGALFASVEPLEEFEWNRFQDAGEYRRFLVQKTALVNLEGSETQMLDGMSQKGRYNIKVAKKHGITTEWQIPDEKNFEAFYHLLTETTKRDGFSGNSKAYYRELLNLLEREHLGGLLFAKKDEHLVAAGIFVYIGKTAIYYYGASSSNQELRKTMATYLLQFEAMLEGKRRECTLYDFLGIAVSDDPKDPLAGVTDFKMKFTQTTKTWPNAKIYIPNRWKYLGFMTLRKLRQCLRGFL